jgi:hypothetical protein
VRKRAIYGSNGRYIVQWVTATNRYGKLVVMGYCVRDRGTSCWNTVFRHESADVCEKLAKILNEGVSDE